MGLSGVWNYFFFIPSSVWPIQSIILGDLPIQLGKSQTHGARTLNATFICIGEVKQENCLQITDYSFCLLYL
jgi:hypothetical protein